MKTLTADSGLVLLRDDQSLVERLAYLEAKSIEMEESIRYAGSLQRSILPNEQIFKNAFTDAFVLFQPKDIVSGDFYWIFQHHDDIYFAVGDCTGHGVPGALVNIAGNTLLRQLIRIEGLTEPGENLSEGNTRDGMDIVFCKFIYAKCKVRFAVPDAHSCWCATVTWWSLKRDPIQLATHLNNEKPLKRCILICVKMINSIYFLMVTPISLVVKM